MRAPAAARAERAPGDERFDLNMLSEDEIAQLRTVFNEVDTNASGDIDEDELYEAMRRAAAFTLRGKDRKVRSMLSCTASPNRM